MNEDTINLLKECNSGSKMAINSMKQVRDFVEDDQLDSLLKNSISKHEKYEDKTSKLLTENGYTEKETNSVVSGLSWFSTEVKLLFNDNNHEIAKLMMDGCNMGIQSISKFVNQYNQASNETRNLASNLIELEERFMDDLKPFL